MSGVLEGFLLIQEGVKDTSLGVREAGTAVGAGRDISTSQGLTMGAGVQPEPQNTHPRPPPRHLWIETCQVQSGLK